ncbi:FAD-binding oxidoreductase [Bacillus sp. FJAT-29790]|uniref:FAD-binding oxidoreductase n=1 Tax=Bacillus sp. FJAT-29790 TaxID=1895002 RepID=UPI001C23732E|nr:FAD-binding oxidoreductase [Bacillus sp. FJAT-29790]
MIAADLLAEMQQFLMEEQITMEESTSHPFGNNGHISVYPKSEEEIATVLKYANDKELSISVMGGGTKRGFGGVIESADILLSLANFKGVVEHTVGDMTLTVKSGTTFQEVQNYLAEFRQKISLDPFWPEYATIGGIIAANDSGPRRLRYGAARDAVIGLRTVYPNGLVIRSGGKVVKNVAGYDMNKLFIGSMGTLGVVSEVTFKLRPLAKYESLVLLTFPEGNLEEMKTFAVKVLDSLIEPVCIELLNPLLSFRLTGQKQYTLAISFEDVESSVHYQEEFLKGIQPKKTELTILHQKEAQTFWEQFYTISPNGAITEKGTETTAALKIGVVNLDVLKMLKESELLQDKNNVIIEAHGGLGHGLCQVIVKGASEDVVAAIHELGKMAEMLGGYAIVKHLPFINRKDVNVWGNRPSYYFLLEGIKEKVDPNKILNPKRFVGGI